MVYVTNYWDVLCNQCILLLENLCHLTGLSYGFINVLFFCILGPLGTICFMGSTATAVYGKSNAVRKNLPLSAGSPIKVTCRAGNRRVIFFML